MKVERQQMRHWPTPHLAFYCTLPNSSSASCFRPLSRTSPHSWTSSSTQGMWNGPFKISKINKRFSLKELTRLNGNVNHSPFQFVYSGLNESCTSLKCNFLTWRSKRSCEYIQWRRMICFNNNFVILSV